MENPFNTLSRSEQIVGTLGLAALSVGAIWMFVRWLFAVPVHPDPWDAETAAALASDECPPVCHHCLASHESSVNFCPECGAAVGPYTNWLPYPYLFSVGHTLRIGTNESFKRSPFVIFGFLLFSFMEYSFFAPVYWFRFFQNLRRAPPPSETDPVPP